MLSSGMSARLPTEVRERRGLCYSIHATCHSLRQSGGVFCYAGTTADRAQETLDVTLGELRRLAEGIQEHELDRLKARIKSALIMQQESSAARSAASGHLSPVGGKKKPFTSHTVMGLGGFSPIGGKYKRGLFSHHIKYRKRS